MCCCCCCRLPGTGLTRGGLTVWEHRFQPGAAVSVSGCSHPVSRRTYGHPRAGRSCWRLSGFLLTAARKKRVLCTHTKQNLSVLRIAELCDTKKQNTVGIVFNVLRRLDVNDQGSPFHWIYTRVSPLSPAFTAAFFCTCKTSLLRVLRENNTPWQVRGVPPRQ